jgi:hypothetical protein
MPHALAPFAPAQDLPISAIEVEARRSEGGRLDLTYRVLGVTSQLSLPEAAPAQRTDELWRHTCLEVFVQAAGEPGYLEFNFSPSGQWASYSFDDYRLGMAASEVVPTLALQRTDGGLELAASLLLPAMAAADWRIALCAVIESVEGRHSYWSLAHPPGKPDFHHAASFALTLAGG